MTDRIISELLHTHYVLSLNLFTQIIEAQMSMLNYMNQLLIRNLDGAKLRVILNPMPETTTNKASLLQEIYQFGIIQSMVHLISIFRSGNR